MRRTIFILLYSASVLALALSLTAEVKAQDANYIILRDAAKKNILEGNFADAKLRISGAAGIANELDSQLYQDEVNELEKELRDSVNAVYNRAYPLIKKDTQKAILLLEQLFDHRGTALHDCAIGQLGFCYVLLNVTEKGCKVLEDGVKSGDALAPFYLARHLQNNNEKVAVDSLLSLYKQSPDVTSSKDSVGCILYRRAEYNEAYFWFKKSSSICSKYYRATMLLDSSISKSLKNEYRKEDPVKLLEQAAKANDYVNASQENSKALFYLGMLYYYAKDDTVIKRDRVKGKEYIKKAYLLGDKNATKVYHQL